MTIVIDKKQLPISHCNRQVSQITTTTKKTIEYLQGIIVNTKLTKVILSCIIFCQQNGINNLSL